MKMKERFWNWANIITLCRIPLILLFIFLLINGSVYNALFVIIVERFLDFFDGFIARKYKWETNIGKKLDPLVDGLGSVSLLIVVFVLEYISLPLFLLIFFTKLFSFLVGTIHINGGKKFIRIHQHGHRPVAVILHIVLVLHVLINIEFLLYLNAILYSILTVWYFVEVLKLKGK